jgi:hypothetical protein
MQAEWFRLRKFRKRFVYGRTSERPVTLGAFSDGCGPTLMTPRLGRILIPSVIVDYMTLEAGSLLCVAGRKVYMVGCTIHDGATVA